VSGNARVFLVAVPLAIAFAGTAVLAGYPADLSPGETQSQGHAGHATDQEPAVTEQSAEAALPGVQVAQDGLRLQLDRASFPAGSRPVPLSFRILDADGRAVRDFDVAHERRLHLIVVRRDLSGFQHLHPEIEPDGTWMTDVRFGAGGTYRVFADFTRDGRQQTLGADVQVGGAFLPQRLPAPARGVRSDGGLEVALRAGSAAAGEEARVEFEVRDRGRDVTGRLQTHLGAKGHLVALREGDLAYLHTHPESAEPTFSIEFPSVGTYRLFLQFRYEGRVHTAAFTQRVSE
jgi:hypothetical protein